MIRSFLKAFFITFLFTLSFSFSWGASVQKTKGKKVLIKLDIEGEVQKGQTVYAVNAAGKKKAIIKIMKVKGLRAIGKTRKGRPKKGMTLQARKKKKKSKGEGDKSLVAKEEETSESSAPGDWKKFQFGLLFGFSLDSQNLLLEANGDPTDVIELSTSGSGISAKIMADYHFSSSFGARVISGLEIFKVSGTASDARCNEFTTAECTTDIKYFSLEGLIRFNFIKGPSTRVWLGGGASLLFPLSFTTTALSSDSINTTGAFLGALGADFKMGSMVIPVQLDYNMLPSSTTVSSSYIGIRVGIQF